MMKGPNRRPSRRPQATAGRRERSASMIIKRLSPEDAVAYRRLRLRGLRASSTAFGSSYAEEARFPLKKFSARLGNSTTNWVFGAFEGDRLVGVVSLVRESRPKEKHKASIYGMYVDRKVRRKGIGRQLLNRVLETARQLPGLRQARLAVVEVNQPALRLYESAGFEIYGREEAALCVSGKFYSELFLAHRLE